MTFTRTPPVGATGFSPYSLGDWLALCEELDIPYVPAREVALVERDDWLKFDQEGPHRGRLEAASAQVVKAVEESGGNHMIRCDPASGMEVKYRLSKGMHTWDESLTEWVCEDPRLFDMVYEYSRVVIPIWMRPWVEAEIVALYPVEYRVFVAEGAVQGLSSYYPQRPLPRRDDEIETVFNHTFTLLEALRERTPFEWESWRTQKAGFSLEALERQKEADQKCEFTADFLVKAGTGEVLFLEGGPPHHRGAHMCCFRPHEISGVALEDRNEELLA